MAGGLSWVASGVGAIGGTAAAVAVQPAVLMPVLVIVIPLAALPLLIPVLALVALYSRDPGRQVRAEKILDRLLTTLQGGRQSTNKDQAGAGSVK